MNETTCKTWQVLNTARKMPEIGLKWLLDLLNIESERHLQRLCADPRTTSSAAPNLIDKYELLLQRFMELGREDIARASVARQALVVGCELRCLDEIRPDSATLLEEICDDHPPITAFHEAVRNGEAVVGVHDLYQQAIRELQETYAMYCKTVKPEGRHD